MADRSLVVLFAPDSFKGTFTSIEVAEALAAGWGRARPGDHHLFAPLADGGEGTLEAITAGGGWDWQTAEVADPLMRPIVARWLRSTDGRTAVLEMAEASGLSRVAPAERDPMRSSTFGTGQLLQAAAREGVDHIVLGIGGSATTEGGRGAISALSGGRIEANGSPLDLSGLDPSLAGIRLEVACDVDNPLLGPRGAAAVYGPQKGASPDQIAELDTMLARWADRLEAATGRRERDTPGAGAAGGLGFALLCLQDRFVSFALRPGVELVMAAASFEAKLAGADVVVTGEGQIDASTSFGKTAMGVAQRARSSGVACVAVGGGVMPEGGEVLRELGAVVVPVAERPASLAELIGEGTAPIERCGERIAELLTLGRHIVDDAR